jgi:hypothetical protein
VLLWVKGTYALLFLLLVSSLQMALTAVFMYCMEHKFNRRMHLTSSEPGLTRHRLFLRYLLRSNDGSH